MSKVSKIEKEKLACDTAKSIELVPFPIQLISLD